MTLSGPLPLQLCFKLNQAGFSLLNVILRSEQCEQTSILTHRTSNML